MRTNKIRYAVVLSALLSAVWAAGYQEARATEYRLAETIDMSGYDMLNIGSDGTNLLILDNDSPDRVKVVDTSGILISSFNTPSNFNSGVTFNGSKIIFANGTSASSKYLREMDPVSGSTSGYLGPNLGSVMGLGFDGANILVSYYANGSNGILTSDITLIDAVTYTNVGTLSVTVNTGTGISATPTYGVAWHSDNLFIALQGVDKVYQFDSMLNLIEEIPILTEWPRGIAFIDDDLFVADRGAQKIYRYEPVVFALSVTPDPLLAGQTATFSAVSGDPFASTYLAFSTTGPGSTWIPYLNVTLDLANPKRGQGPTMSNGNGDVTWTLPVPNLPGLSVWLQGVQYDKVTNLVATSIQ